MIRKRRQDWARLSKFEGKGGGLLQTWNKMPRGFFEKFFLLSFLDRYYMTLRPFLFLFVSFVQKQNGWYVR